MSLVSRSGALAYGLAAGVIAVDQAVKAWITGGLRLTLGVPQPLLGPLRLTLVENRGVSFGLFSADAAWGRWALAAFSLLVAVGLGAWVRKAEKSFTGVAIGLIIGGAVGNLIDRVRLGVVVDFVDATALMFPWVFNVADSAISIGSVLLIWDLFLAPRKNATG